MHFKMIATSGFFTALECTKFVFGAPLGSLQHSLRPLAGLKGLTSKGKGKGGERKKGEGERRERWGRRGGERRKREIKEGDWGTAPLWQISGSALGVCLSVCMYVCIVKLLISHPAFTGTRASEPLASIRERHIFESRHLFKCWPRAHGI